MIVDVFSQPYELLVMLYGGLLTGLVYELLRFFRCLDPGLTWGMDVLSFASGGYIFIRSLLTATYGVPRWYALAGFGAGMGLARLGFRWLFTEICQKIHKNQYPTRP